MKRTTFIAAVLCLLGTGLSCTHDEPNNSDTGTGQRVVEWEDSTLSGDAVIGFSVGNSLNVTRSQTDFDGQGYTLSEGDRITIALTRNDVETKKTYIVNGSGKLVYDGDEVDAFHWKSATETVKLRAWSYGNSTAYPTDPVGSTFTLNTTQTETTSGVDNYKELLYAPQWDCTYTDDVPINLYHQMSRLTIELTHLAESSLNVSQVTIGDGTLPTKAKFSEDGIDTANDDYIGTWNTKSATTGQIIARVDTASKYKYSAVLFPDTLSEGASLVNIATTDGNVYSYKIPTGETVGMEAGKQYNYKVSVTDFVETSTLTIGDIDTYTYDGNEKQPHPTVYYGTKLLTEGTHYSLSWSNNTNAGTATCTVTGLGIFSGTKTKDFTINKAVGTISDLTFTNSIKIGYTTTASVTNTGDGTVVYTSGATNLATVNGSTLTGLNAGSPVITATVTDGANYTYVTKTLTKTLTVTSDVGKVLGANGQFYSTVSAATSAGTTASGIVAYMGLPGSIDESSSTYRYLVIALTDGNANGENLRFHTENSATNCGLGSTGINDALSIINGIATTNSLVNSNGAGLTSYCNGHTHGIARAAREVNTSRPSGASAWFLPSLGQWQLIVQGLATKKAGYPITTPLYQDKDVNDEYKQTNLNSVITDAGGTGFTGTDYWSCTEYYSGVSVYSMYFTKGRYSGLAKTRYEFPFRAVFAY